MCLQSLAKPLDNNTLSKGGLPCSHAMHVLFALHISLLGHESTDHHTQMKSEL